jgi:hypothetical protein
MKKTLRMEVKEAIFLCQNSGMGKNIRANARLSQGNILVPCLFILGGVMRDGSHRYSGITIDEFKAEVRKARKIYKRVYNINYKEMFFDYLNSETHNRFLAAEYAGRENGAYVGD